MQLSEERIKKIISEAIKSVLNEGKAVFIQRRNWDYLDYNNGQRVLECTPKSIIMCSDDCMNRFIAYKRYEKPDTMNLSTGWYTKYWKFLGWEVKVIRYRNGHWELFDNSFPKILKSKEDVFSFIKRTNTFNLAKRELHLS